MKKAFLLGVAMFVALCALTAQPKPDTGQTAEPTLIVKPVFNGTEKTAVDSVAAVAYAITDPQTKAVLLDAVNAIKNTPDDKTAEAWIGYVLAVLAAVAGIYQYAKKKLVQNQLKQVTLEQGSGPQL